VIHFGCLLEGIQRNVFPPVSQSLLYIALTDEVVYLLSLPLPTYPLPVIELHSPLPPPILTGAPLFIAAVKNLRKPWLLPDIPKDTIVAFTTAYGDEDGVRYVGVGRIMSEGGMRGAVERREQVLREGVDRDEGKFCDILCIIGDQ
jgi:translation initiation factor 2D